MHAYLYKMKIIFHKVVSTEKRELKKVTFNIEIRYNQTKRKEKAIKETCRNIPKGSRRIRLVTKTHNPTFFFLLNE